MKQENIEYALAAIFFIVLFSFYFLFVDPYLTHLISENESFKADILAMDSDAVSRASLLKYLDSEQKTFNALAATWIGIQFLIVGVAMIVITGIRRVSKENSVGPNA